MIALAACTWLCCGVVGTIWLACYCGVPIKMREWLCAAVCVMFGPISLWQAAEYRAEARAALEASHE